VGAIESINQSNELNQSIPQEAPVNAKSAILKGSYYNYTTKVAISHQAALIYTKFTQMLVEHWCIYAKYNGHNGYINNIFTPTETVFSPKVTVFLQQ
jgi:hypothetical protein